MQIDISGLREVKPKIEVRENKYNKQKLLHLE